LQHAEGGPEGVRRSAPNNPTLRRYENQLAPRRAGARREEDSVQFPTNFRELGYISFAKDQLEAKAMEILKELIGFGIVKVST